MYETEKQKLLTEIGEKLTQKFEKNYEFEKNKLIEFTPSDIYDTIKAHNGVIAGGAITSLFCNRDINDVDVYFKSKKSASEFVRDMIQDKIHIVSITDKSVLFKKDDVEIQAVFFDSFEHPEDIFDTFDFTVCMGAFDCNSEKFTLHPDFLRHNSQRQLRFNPKTAFPIISMLRVDKYRSKGYKISRAEFVKIGLAVSNLKIESFDQLKHHIGGMYGDEIENFVDIKHFDNGEFSMDLVFEAIDKMPISSKKKNVNYLEKHNLNPYGDEDDLERIIVMISGEKRNAYKINGNLYDENFITYSDDMEKYFNIIEAPDKITFYKWVKPDGENKFCSYYDNTFKYVIGEECEYSGHGIYGTTIKNRLEYQTYHNKCDRVALALETSPNDVVSFASFRTKKATPVAVLHDVPECNSPPF